MRLIAIKPLREFWKKHADAEQPLRAWHAEIKKATWTRPQEVKLDYPQASILPKDRVVFNMSGNNYRLVVAMRYDFQIAYVRFIGTHSEYDRINAEKA